MVLGRGLGKFFLRAFLRGGEQLPSPAAWLDLLECFGILFLNLFLYISLFLQLLLAPVVVLDVGFMIFSLLWIFFRTSWGFFFYVSLGTHLENLEGTCSPL